MKVISKQHFEYWLCSLSILYNKGMLSTEKTLPQPIPNEKRVFIPLQPTVAFLSQQQWTNIRTTCKGHSLGTQVH